jgi:hypothetical protein
MGGALVGAGSHNPQICVLPCMLTWASSTLVILIFRNVENFQQNVYILEIKFLKENKESDGNI